MKLIINGIAGSMGKMVLQCASARDFSIAGVDLYGDPKKFEVPVYKTLQQLEGKFDCIIDYSVKASLPLVLKYAVETKTAAVLCTTGYDAEDMKAIDNAAKIVPIFQSGNMSLGINILLKLVGDAARLLKGKADIEIVEQHHNQKADAPSGTAKMLANCVKSAIPQTEFIYGREGMVGKRTPEEVAIHAVRGGTIVGKHEVIFAMNNQVITLKHEAESKSVFAEGSLDAAEWLLKQPAGRYNMDDMLK